MKQGKLEKYLLKICDKHCREIDKTRFTKRVGEGNFLKSENLLSHFCAMFVTYDPDTKKILVVHHRKANSWIFPGGHLEKDEFPEDTVAREAQEELGLKKKDMNLTGLVAIQRLDINNPPQICAEHFDIFYAMSTNEDRVRIDEKEFFSHAWLGLKEAREKITLPYYLEALEKFVVSIGW